MFSARPSLDALATPTVAAFWLAPHFGQNAADPSSEPQALQNAMETPPRRSVARSVTKDLFRRNFYCSRFYCSRFFPGSGPLKLRGSPTVLREPRGEIPRGYSPHRALQDREGS